MLQTVLKEKTNATNPVLIQVPKFYTAYAMKLYIKNICN